MKKAFLILAAAVLALPVFASSEYPDISINEVKTAIADKSATVIDVNGSESYAKGHVPSALDYDAIKGDLKGKLPADKGALIIAYCGGPGCNAYTEAANAAKALGYTNVKHMSAGISGWNKAEKSVK